VFTSDSTDSSTCVCTSVTNVHPNVTNASDTSAAAAITTASTIANATTAAAATATTTTTAAKIG
jgi:hypothetical protein